MKRYMWSLCLGVVLIIVSTPLAYSVVNIVYANKNLAGEYVPILNGFIHSFMLVGALISIFGLIQFVHTKKV